MIKPGLPYAPYTPTSSTYTPSPDSSSNASSSSSTTSSQPRQRLRPWLVDQINSAKIPGLKWLDYDKMIFKIPWKHFGRPGVDEYNDAMLFRNWAKHTKKYQEGQPGDISTWKTRFRCALHKLPDIEELNHLNQTDGDDPYRVYQFKKKDGKFTPAASPMSLPADVNPVLSSAASSPYSALTSDDVKQELDTLGNEGLLDEELSILGIDDVADMIDPYDWDPSLLNPTLSAQQNIPNPHVENVHQNNLLQQMQPRHAVPQPNNSVIAVGVKLYYANQEVKNQIVDNPKGLRIAFNALPSLPDDIVGEDTSQVVSHIFGPLLAEQIYFPHSNDPQTMKILECINRGLVLQARDGQILATRLCRAKVFYSDSESPTNVRELPREHTTVVFNYVNEFLPQLQAYMLGQAPLPTYERFFSFGQKWSQTSILRNSFVYVNISHCLAKAQLSLIQNQKSEVLVSEPNTFDFIAKQIEDLRLTPTL